MSLDRPTIACAPRLAELLVAALLVAACSSPAEQLKADSGTLLDDASGRLRIAAGNQTIEALTRGAFAEADGDFEEARKLYSLAMQRDPADERTLVAFARTYIAQGRAREAAELLQRQLQGRPNSAVVQRAAGEAMLAAGEPLLALPALRRAWDLAPDDRATLAPLAQTLLLTGQHADLLALLGAAGVDELPEPLLESVARLALAAEQPQLAVSLLLRHLALHSQDAEAWVDLARCQFQLDQIDLAGQALVQALTLEPYHGQAMLLLGHVRFLDGDLVRARRCYETALSNGAEPTQVHALLDRLRALVLAGEPLQPLAGAGGAGP